MTGAVIFSGTVTSGSYRLVRTLGRQGGRVHEARHDHLAGRFAVKVFSDVEPGAFRLGAQRASALRHPGIVQVVDYSASGEQAFVVMEYVEGRSLAAIFAASGAMPADRAARLVDSIALGLQAAHRQGIAHGRLAPERIFVLPPEGDHAVERTKLGGFGLGEELTSLQPPTEVTTYTAPEQTSRNADARSDQFALAAIAYEALTGYGPFGDGPDRPAPPPIRKYAPDVNVIVDDVIQRALSADPSARWPDIYTFTERLRDAAVAHGDREERTRLAPLPLTLSRRAPMATPTPIGVKVVASVDVDLGTPAPQDIDVPILRGHTMSPPARLPPPSRGPASGRPHSIRPTPTFHFADELDEAALRRIATTRRRNGAGIFLLAVVMLAAGFAGYVTVKYHAWQDTGPLVARVTQLVNALRSLAPGARAAPSPAETTPTPPSAAPGSSAAPNYATPSPGATLHPLVVPIAPPMVAPVPARATGGPHRFSRPRSHRARKPLSDEAAAEEALLAAPPR